MSGEAITERLRPVGRARAPQGVRPRTLRMPAVPAPRRGLVGEEADVAVLLETWLDGRSPRLAVHRRALQHATSPDLAAALEVLRPAFDAYRDTADRECDRCWASRLCITHRTALRAWWDARDAVVRAITTPGAP